MGHHVLSAQTHYYNSAPSNFVGLQLSFGVYDKDVFSLIVDYLVINLSN